MKKILTSVLLIMFGISVSGQQSELKQQFTKQDYLQKSKSQNTAALILTGGGAALVISGLVVHGSERSYFPNEQVGTVLIVCGGVAITAGVILFIASSRNNNNADKMDMSFNLKLEKADIIQKTALKNNYYPALSLNISLK